MAAEAEMVAVQRGNLDHALRSLMAAAQAIGLFGLELYQGNTEAAHDHRLQASENVFRAAGILRAAGATSPEYLPVATPIPLHLLNTPDTRELLALLQHAQEVAERVDAARGRALPPHFPLQPGESYGTDLAESISELALRLRTEVEGPRGRE